MRSLKTRIKHFISPKYAYLKRFPIRSGDVVIDLGANVGEVSEYFLSRGAIVEAYEPNPHALAVLHQRHARHKRLKIYPVAVSDQSGQARLYLHESHTQGEVLYSQAASLKAEKANVSPDYVEVEVTAISDILARHAHIRLMKIDIEGGEYDIMDDILAAADKIDYILLETHEKKNPAFQAKNAALLSRIEALGLGHKIYTDWF